MCYYINRGLCNLPTFKLPALALTLLRQDYRISYCSKYVIEYRRQPRSIVAYSAEVAHRAVLIR